MPITGISRETIIYIYIIFYRGNCYLKYSFSPHLQWPQVTWILVNSLSEGHWNPLQQKQYSEEQATLLSPKPSICVWKFLSHPKCLWEKKRKRKTFLLSHYLNIHHFRKVPSNWFYFKISNNGDTFHEQLNKIFQQITSVTHLVWEQNKAHTLKRWLLDKEADIKPLFHVQS